MLKISSSVHHEEQILKIGALTKLGLFFPVVHFIHVFDQTLAEQLYCDKGIFA